MRIDRSRYSGTGQVRSAVKSTLVNTYPWKAKEVPSWTRKRSNDSPRAKKALTRMNQADVEGTIINRWEQLAHGGKLQTHLRDTFKASHTQGTHQYLSTLTIFFFFFLRLVSYFAMLSTLTTLSITIHTHTVWCDVKHTDNFLNLIINTHTTLYDAKHTYRF